jgi:hypothetical protein
VEACARDNLDGHLVPAPDILAPQLGRDLDRPHSLSPADDLAILAGRRATAGSLDAGSDTFLFGRDAAFDHGHEEALNHRVQLGGLGLEVGVLDVADDSLEDEGAEVWRGRD